MHKCTFRGAKSFIWTHPPTEDRMQETANWATILWNTSQRAPTTCQTAYSMIWAYLISQLVIIIWIRDERGHHRKIIEKGFQQKGHAVAQNQSSLRTMTLSPSMKIWGKWWLLIRRIRSKHQSRFKNRWTIWRILWRWTPRSYSQLKTYNS